MSNFTTSNKENVETIIKQQLNGFDEDLLNYVISIVEEMTVEERFYYKI
jgi:hypothetical protein